MDDVRIKVLEDSWIVNLAAVTVGTILATVIDNNINILHHATNQQKKDQERAFQETIKRTPKPGSGTIDARAERRKQGIDVDVYVTPDRQRRRPSQQQHKCAPECKHRCVDPEKGDVYKCMEKRQQRQQRRPTRQPRPDITNIGIRGVLGVTSTLKNSP